MSTWFDQLSERARRQPKRVIFQDASENALKRRTKIALNLAALMVRIGEADCLAAGVQHSTGDVILASQMMIGLAEGISTVSSLGILEVPGFDGPEGNLLTITDCAVCPFPTSDELADIAISSADTMRRLLGWEPRVAMLTFSTKGSAQHERVEHVIRAVHRKGSPSRPENRRRVPARCGHPAEDCGPQGTRRKRRGRQGQHPRLPEP